MKRLSLWVLASVAFGLAASPLEAANAANSKSSPRVVTRKAAGADASAPGVDTKATAAAYSAQVNIVTRVQGTAFFRTAIDITNNTNTDGVVAQVQYCYAFGGNFQCTQSIDIGLAALDNFHDDDMVQYLGTQGVLVPGAADASFGTLLVTFQNLPSNFGWEGTVTARTYSPLDANNAAAGTLAIAYPGSLFFESANTTLVGTLRNTLTAPTEAGALRTNLGVTNTDLNGVGAVNVALSFYDPATGQAVGNVLNVNNLQPGEVRQTNNVWAAAGIPSSVQSVIAFADITSPASGFPTIEGYVNILDDDTKDGAYFEMKCADTEGCGN